MSSRRSVQTGPWSRVIQVFGSNRHLEPCHPDARFKQILGAMSSPRGAARWLRIYGFKGRHKRVFTALFRLP